MVNDNKNRLRKLGKKLKEKVRFLLKFFVLTYIWQ